MENISIHLCLSVRIREKLKELVGKKLKKGKTAEEIADMLEEDPQVIKELIKEIEKEGRS